MKKGPDQRSVARSTFTYSDTGSLVFDVLTNVEENYEMLILIILLVILLGSGGGYYGHRRWGYAGGAGTGLGTILVILLIAYLLGLFN